MRRTAVAIGLVTVLALAGCAATRGAVGMTDPVPVPTTATPTGSTSGTTTMTPPVEPAATVRRCAGVDTTAPPVALTADAAVASITLCLDGYTYVPGSGDWLSWDTHAVPADRLPELVAALAQPSAAPDPHRICDAMLVIVPTVAVDAADGTAGLAQVPSDGCHSQQRVRELLYDIVDATPAAVEPVALIRDEQALRTGCLGAKPIVPSPGPVTTVEVPDAALSACVYVTGSGEDTALTAAARIDDAIARRLVSELGSTPPAGCGTSTTQVGDFVAVVTAVDPGAADQQPTVSERGGVTLFSVATTGCPVVVDGAWTILGWADPDDVTTLVAATS